MNVMSWRLLFKKQNGVCEAPGIKRSAWCVALLISALGHAGLAVAEIPPAAQKKPVSLNNTRAEAERIFANACVKCHVSPNPVGLAWERSDCTKGLSKGENVQVQAYLADVNKGKISYESHCGRCHELISPGAHTREYWQNNVCTSEECFIENLKDEEEQQVLLYLSSQAKKN